MVNSLEDNFSRQEIKILGKVGMLPYVELACARYIVLTFPKMMISCQQIVPTEPA